MMTQRGWLAGLSVFLSMGSALEIQAERQVTQPRLVEAPVVATTNQQVQNSATAAQDASAQAREASPVSAQKAPTSAIPHPNLIPECILAPQPESAYPDVGLGWKLLW